VQGDQPFIDPALIDVMAEQFSARTPTPEVLTPVYLMGAGKIHNPSVVKTLLAADGRALYFSRSAIPHVRGVAPDQWHAHAPYWGHVGIYGYRSGFLCEFPTLPQAPIEQLESLEQLRALWHGHRIAVHITQNPPGMGVDTPEDLARVRSLLADPS
jgi:3-deoxy-manno-octulosonate cytidylyltransferase (CMP-KDO synthetase)